jgi:DNA modification methylase
VAAIAGSMREWGWTMPCLVAEACDGVPDGEIIAGHGRVLAAAEIYAAGGTIRMADGTVLEPGMVPVIAARGWSASQRRAYVVADNQLTLSGTWDEGVLRLELMDLREEGFRLGLLGFDDPTLAGLLDVRLETESDPEVAPLVPARPVSRPGDLWLLGRHRLLCGDATNQVDVSRLLNGAQPWLMVTDPPYGVNYDPEWRMQRGLSHNQLRMGAVPNDDRADWREAWRLFPGDVAYVWHASLQTGRVQISLEESGFDIVTQIIWAKDRLALSRGDYHWQHEPCLYAVRQGRRHRWTGARDQTSVWQIAAREEAEYGHATQKPLACMRRPMDNNSQPGEAIYDPFVGSGTSIVAAEMSGRACLALDISPDYCDVSLLRWQNITGQVVTNEDGEPFAAIREQRHGEDAGRVGEAAAAGA